MIQSANSMDSMQAEIWHVASDVGIVEFSREALEAAIRSGQVFRHNLVWHQGMGEWLALDQVPLLQLLAVACLEVPSEATHPQPVPTQVNATAVFDDSFDDFDPTIVQSRPTLPDDDRWTVEAKEPAEESPTPALFSLNVLAKRVAMAKSLEALERSVPSDATSLTQGPKRPTEANGVQPTATQNTALDTASPTAPQPVASTNREAPPRALLTSKPPPKLHAEATAKPSIPPRRPPTARNSSVAPSRLPPTPVTISEGTERKFASAIVDTRKVTQPQPVAPIAAAARATQVPDVKPTGVVPAATPVTRAITANLAVATPTAATPNTHVQSPNHVPMTATRTVRAAQPLAASVVVQLESTEFPSSLYPSTASLCPEQVEWRRSRRPLFVVAGAIAAVAVVAIVFAVSSSKQSAGAAAAMQMPEPPTPSENHDNTTANAAVTPEPTAKAPEEPEPTREPSTPSARKPSKTTTTPSISYAGSADSPRPKRKALLVEDSAVGGPPEPEPTKASVERSSPAKSPTGNTQSSQSSSTSVTTWDKGPEERRAWMRPGF